MKEKDIKKIESVEQLARLTQLEFLEMGGCLDRLERKTDEGFKSVVDTLDLIRGDVHDMKIALGPLTRTLADLEESVRYLDKRVSRLEKAGHKGLTIGWFLQAGPPLLTQEARKKSLSK